MDSINSLMDLSSNETRRNLITLGKNSIDEYITNKYVKTN